MNHPGLLAKLPSGACQPREPFKMQILTIGMGVDWDSEFLISSQVTPMLLVLGPHFE